MSYEVTFFERIFRPCWYKLVHCQQPIKDAHDSHVIEQHSESGELFGGAVVDLHL